ncbi:uncharacterized protein FOMMEDRAFT_141154 [Fomitiporia mediterranea MF3/22]|uniref:uncharacterized protein n=1 Tax=Fomitiporia mediterranea (strain MF3/22) TaxID=694068 RepID=UPI00044085BC|nr:uncharacterized protein FOMMEDRAFT_141154 [Fomitiporia mediterranea MF3/22]EJD01938.1 hypothetical protein FOMMEDRAFT_141154 [Fomitiporia mediterranea MF3/22]
MNFRRKTSVIVGHLIKSNDSHSYDNIKIALWRRSHGELRTVDMSKHYQSRLVLPLKIIFDSLETCFNSHEITKFSSSLVKT